MPRRAVGVRQVDDAVRTLFRPHDEDFEGVALLQGAQLREVGEGAGILAAKEIGRQRLHKGIEAVLREGSHPVSRMRDPRQHDLVAAGVVVGGHGIAHMQAHPLAQVPFIRKAVVRRQEFIQLGPLGQHDRADTGVGTAERVPVPLGPVALLTENHAVDPVPVLLDAFAALEVYAQDVLDLDPEKALQELTEEPEMPVRGDFEGRHPAHVVPDFPFKRADGRADLLVERGIPLKGHVDRGLHLPAQALGGEPRIGPVPLQEQVPGGPDEGVQRFHQRIGALPQVLFAGDEAVVFPHEQSADEPHQPAVVVGAGNGVLCNHVADHLARDHHDGVVPVPRLLGRTHEVHKRIPRIRVFVYPLASVGNLQYVDSTRLHLFV